MANRYLHSLAVSVLSLSVGCLLGVFPAQAEDQFSMNALTVESKSGDSLGSSTASSDMAGFFQAQKTLVNHMLTQIGIPPESLPPEVQADLAKPQTTNIQALIAFSTGLDQLDKGEFAEAKASFATATHLDPGFQLALTLQVAMPDKPTTVAEVSVKADAKGKAKAKAVLEKVAKVKNKKEAKKSEGDSKKDKDGKVEKSSSTDEEIDVDEGSDLGLGSAGQEKVLVEIKNAFKSSVVVTNPIEKSVITEKPVINDKITDAITTVINAPSTAYESTPACAGALCGFYATLLGKSSTGSQIQHLLTTPYVTAKGVALTTGGTVQIAQLGGAGYLKGETSPALANINSFKDGSSSASGSSSISPIVLDGKVESISGVSNVAVGYYKNDFTSTLSSGTDGYGVFRNQNSEYGRLFFAEGRVTPATDLNTLAQHNTTYTYTGAAEGNLAILQSSHSGGSPFTSSSGYRSTSGIFSTHLNFSKGQATNFNTSLGFEDGSQISIKADSATLNSDGSFGFQPGSQGVNFQVTLPSSISPNAISMQEGQISGQTFGANAAEVGGVFAGHASETITPQSGTSTPSTYDISTSGYFAGSRPDASGGTTGTAP